MAHQPVFGTNGGAPSVIAAFDYAQWHTGGPIDPASCQGKPCGVNEHNPVPAFTPSELFGRVCAARGEGTWFSYWRHGQSAEEMDQTLALMQRGCP
jgi:hypothetical protein